MKHKIEEEEVYDDLLDHVMHLLNEHNLPVELIASALMVIGQRLYRTHLTDQGYDAMMDMIRDYPVEPYKVTKERLH